jgi:hypothetical protein
MRNANPTPGSLYDEAKSGTSAWFLSFLESAKEELMAINIDPRTPDATRSKASVWPFLLLIVLVVVVAWASYTYFLPASPPNFHW